jgi:dTDP-4-dehydrorhamnose reductase
MLAITGSGGFLGKKFIEYSKTHLKEKVFKLPKIIKKNKFNEFYFKKNKLSDYLIKKKINCIIHFAGVRKNVCEENYTFAKKSIFDLTKNICNQILASKLDILFIYISTDHVFDGSTKLYQEKNSINKRPKTKLGKLKLTTENYIAEKLRKFSIIRLSAVMDDPRLSSFVKKSLKNKTKLDLFSNVFFSPVLSHDLNRLIKVIKNKKFENEVFHCSGNKRLSKYSFYSELFNNKKNFIKKKLLDFRFNPHDLSLSNKKTCKTLKIKMTNFKKSLNICKKAFNI